MMNAEPRGRKSAVFVLHSSFIVHHLNVELSWLGKVAWERKRKRPGGVDREGGNPIRGNPRRPKENIACSRKRCK
jgi:hypothetical protein